MAWDEHVVDVVLDADGIRLVVRVAQPEGAPLVSAQVLRAEPCPGGFDVELAFVGKEFRALR